MGLVTYTTLLIAIFVTILNHETHPIATTSKINHRYLTLINIIKDTSGHIGGQIHMRHNYLIYTHI